MSRLSDLPSDGARLPAAPSGDTDLFGAPTAEAPEPGVATTRLKAGVLFPMPLPEPFDYAIPDHLEVRPGDHVAAPISGRVARGVVWRVEENDGARALKEIVERYPAPPVPEVSRNFVEWVARYTCSNPGSVLRMALRGSSPWKPPPEETVYSVIGEAPAKLTDARRKVLAVAEQGAATAANLAKEAGVSTSVVKGLAEAGVLSAQRRLVDKPFEHPDLMAPGLDLTQVQLDAARELVALVRGGGYASALLDGVTGSGKTEVYFEAIAEALGEDEDAQVLVLLPEIALTQAVIGRFEQRFGARPAEWHSDVSDADRRRTWRAVAKGEARIVVGARSALFLPYKKLRLIVVDEEHDTSFKQEEGVVYHARDMAVLRAKLGEAAIILASATPSIESLVNAQRGRYAYVSLPGRPGVSVLPQVDAIDLRIHRPAKDRWISPPLLQAVTDTLANGEQALLFLNRRGYAPLVICRACGHKMKAPDTDSWLVEHRYTGRLICHRTGFSMPKPERCPECKEVDSLHAVGPGVERLEEEARLTFPHARVDVFSSDTAKDPAAVRAKVEAMEKGEIDVLVGTQIVAKGHNFPRLTLVGVVDADLGLKGGDLRAGERTYQTLVQVAGRAGRADKPGRALLQSCMPDHEAISALVEGDRDAFLSTEIEGRRDLGLPPYGRLAAVIMAGPDEAKLDAAARAAAKVAPLADGVDVMGPAEPPIAVVRGRFRRRFLIRSDAHVDLSAYMSAWRARMKTPGAIRVQIDIDPYSFL